MKGTIMFCFLAAVLLAVIPVVFLIRKRKEFSMREVLTGTLLYAVGRRMIYPVLSGIVSEIYNGILMQAIAAAGSLFLSYFLLYVVFYRKEKRTLIAPSVAIGAIVPELVFTYACTLLSDAVLLNAVMNGNAGTLLAQQGMNAGAVQQTITYYQSFTTGDAINVILQAAGCILINLFVSESVQEARNGRKKDLIYVMAYTFLFTLCTAARQVLLSEAGMGILLVMPFMICLVKQHILARQKGGLQIE